MKLKFIMPDGLIKISNDFYFDATPEFFYYDHLCWESGELKKVFKKLKDFEYNDDFLTFWWNNNIFDVDIIIEAISDEVGMIIDKFEEWTDG